MTIDNKTTIPLFVAIGGLPLIVGGLLWLTTIDATASAAKEASVRNEVQITDQSKILLDIRERLVRIEATINKNKGDR